MIQLSALRRTGFWRPVEKSPASALFAALQLGDCRVCGKQNGTWEWPEGLGHYIRERFGKNEK